jgi:tetraacyldisaccharide 4'-kinase
MSGYLYNLATDKYNGLIPALMKFFLFLLSLIYGLAIRVLMFFYGMKPFRPACKVISVGNVTLGGTGKTPLVAYIVRRLKERGHKVAIITRGYLNSDEPRMLQEDLKDVPVVVDADRVGGIKRAISEYAVDTAILDDGFQQWRIKKDLDIVAIDSLNPFGNKQMIPRGILRQPLSSLKTAQVFMLTKTDRNPELSFLENFLSQINPGAVIAESVHSPVGFYELGRKDSALNLSILKGKTVALVCGIADPASFAHSLKSLGITIGLAFEFSDHYNYSLKDLEGVINAARQKGIDTIVTTEKDAVKLCKLQKANSKLQIFVLRIELQITKNEKGFLERLSGVYGI